MAHISTAILFAIISAFLYGKADELAEFAFATCFALATLLQLGIAYESKHISQ